MRLDALTFGAKVLVRYLALNVFGKCAHRGVKQHGAHTTNIASASKDDRNLLPCLFVFPRFSEVISFRAGVTNAYEIQAKTPSRWFYENCPWMSTNHCAVSRLRIHRSILLKIFSLTCLVCLFEVHTVPLRFNSASLFPASASKLVV